MKSNSFYYRLPTICLLFIGSIPLTAQKISKQCLQKLKLTSDKIILTFDHYEQPVQTEIIIDPANSSIRTTIQMPNKQDKKVTNYKIKEIKCEMNEELTSGNIVYRIENNNPDGSFSDGGFILKANPQGLTFSNTTDPPENTAIIPVSKYEVIK
ncbi:hypothetical protein H5J24_22185 [Chryseobacterium capnotolerans]|uniref:hypothetical protein n=1 Tax=Chryseobacterium TaxID=59732 RepID=UPI00083B6C29|nr:MULTISPECIES: hypothetical protein [Chryseobacterium]UHO38232.1 hypothetical protein H5J24_22185 [Chryseobacterium capnotolerans]